jgi:hypothetical protein
VARGRGRPAFVPTDEQRRNVEAMVGFGIPEAEICNLIRNPENGKPIDEKTLRKHFKDEIAQGAVKVKLIVGQFMVASILGREVPAGAGMMPLKDERARAKLASLFAKARMGWRETVVNRHENKHGKPFIVQIGKNDGKL